MNIEFYGAAGCVTGSCHIMKVKDKTILLDCGMYQGRDEKERGNENFPFNPKEIDYVILSHAHIDHSGRIPMLYKKGFKGEIICTKATKDLCRIMLEDSGHIQEMEAEWKNRKRIRQGIDTIEPLYTAKIAELSSYLFKGFNYGEVIELFDGFKVCFKDAGHLLGAAIVELYIKEPENEEVKIVYTGDLGNTNIPILNDPTTIEYADYVIMETTYGDREHVKVYDEFKELIDIIKQTIIRGGNVVIPSFSVGRTQEIIYILNKYVESELLKDIKVYVDSPLAVQSTRVFEHYADNFDEEAKKLILEGDNPFKFDGLVFSESVEDSVKINKIQSGAVVVSASGMCEAGRIKHHLKHNLWRKECSIVFVGYQAEGTLGRTILEGARKVKIFGEEIAVNAKIYNLQGLSGHADRNGLINWLKAFKSMPKEILLVHGDKESQQSFKELAGSSGFKVRTMQLGDKYYINEKVEETDNIKAKIIRYVNSIENMENISKDDFLDHIRTLLYEK